MLNIRLIVNSSELRKWDSGTRHVESRFDIALRSVCHDARRLVWV
jgi:hypothetical protein